jgi:hypothetical protein
MHALTVFRSPVWLLLHKLPHTRTITMQYSFFPSAIRTWNTLPQQLASMTSLEGFRQALANTTHAGDTASLSVVVHDKYCPSSLNSF